MAVARFEDLIAWQKARELAAEIYRATAGDGFARDWGLRDQVRRAAVSTMANVAEGYGRNRRAEFQRFLDIAIGSNAEVISHLYIISDIGYLPPEQCAVLRSRSLELALILKGLRRSVAATSDSGLRTSDS